MGIQASCGSLGSSHQMLPGRPIVPSTCSVLMLQLTFRVPCSCPVVLPSCRFPNPAPYRLPATAQQLFATPNGLRCAGRFNTFYQVGWCRGIMDCTALHAEGWTLSLPLATDMLPQSMAITASDYFTSLTWPGKNHSQITPLVSGMPHATHASCCRVGTAEHVMLHVLGQLIVPGHDAISHCI